MMDLVTRLLTGLDGAGETKGDWILSIGPNLFDRLCQIGILEGPSGVTEARCFDCDDAGHIAPVVRVESTYQLFCPQAGLVTLRDSTFEQYRVARWPLLIEIARAFEVSKPDKELRMLTEGLHFLGRAHIGKTPFSLIFADRIRTREAFDDLMRRNREGFGQEKGIILVAADIWQANRVAGRHEIVQAASICDFDELGVHPRWSEIRRLLGQAGRPQNGMTAADEATERFRILLEKHRDFPEGQKGFELFRDANKDLAHLKDATLYAAKAKAMKF